MFALLVVTLVAAALTDTSEVKELDNSLIVGEQFVENTLTGLEEPEQETKN
ncbi:hypothetical protein [Zobellia sp. B3R18]|uniref:hypothetical protein n=1 Tax=Zobellia sp. B3R18 TaxID=2841568 RepID=UPI001C06EB7F|nr:hypothetical protein [Zobellia sp. B3R18]MBU2974756.1 hypothetical protein [Zobellia sp. B3R18]